MKETILLTGGTGLLGAYLLRSFLNLKNGAIGRISVLCRGKTKKETQRRVQQPLWGHLPLRQKRGLMSLLEVVRGDIAQENLGLSKGAYNRIINEVTLIYHSAAICDFETPLSVVRRVNVTGTKNILDLALAARKKGNFKCFNHISTVAVAGDKTGIFYEKDLDLGQGFNNPYEQSKFEAEKAVEKYRRMGLPVTIYRPSIIVGDSKTGYTNNFKMFYQPLHLFCMEFYKEIPADRNTIFSFVPVDYVAEAITRISLDNSLKKNLTYHIINPNKVRFGFFLDAASRYFKFRKPAFIPLKKINLKDYSPLQFSLIKPFIPYFNYQLWFDSNNFESILSKTKFKWPQIDEVFLKRLFKFCIHSGFIKPKGKK